MSRRALIIGGSVGGLFAATLLRTIGWETLVFLYWTASIFVYGGELNSAMFQPRADRKGAAGYGK